jgi:hypothetical protein
MEVDEEEQRPDRLQQRSSYAQVVLSSEQQFVSLIQAASGNLGEKNGLL